jgi:hypothetical protein
VYEVLRCVPRTCPPCGFISTASASPANSRRPVDAATACCPLALAEQLASDAHCALTAEACRTALRGVRCSPVSVSVSLLSCGLPAVQRCRESCSIADENDSFSTQQTSRVSRCAHSSRSLAEELVSPRPLPASLKVAASSAASRTRRRTQALAYLAISGWSTTSTTVPSQPPTSASPLPSVKKPQAPAGFPVQHSWTGRG